MTEQVSTEEKGELFKLDGKPSFGEAFPQAMQHVLAMLVGNITPPMLIAGTCGLSAADQTMLMQSAMIIGGLTTLVQLFPVLGFGMGLPSVMGVAFAYMPILTTIGMQYGIAAIFGAQLVAAFVSISSACSSARSVSSSRPSCAARSCSPSACRSMPRYQLLGGGAGAKAAGTFGSPEFWILAAVTLGVTLACSLFGKGYIKISGMVIGVGVGYVVALIMGA